MIVGDGLIASAFYDDYENDENVIIFASGVSNSLETDSNEFKREEDLLIKTILENNGKHLLYFASYVDSNILKRSYAEHKQKMEGIIKESKIYYTILKLPQAIGWGGNKTTLVNFIIGKLKNNEEITVYKNTYKSLIDVEDVKRIVDIRTRIWGDKNIYIEFPYIEKLLVHEIVELIAKQLKITPKIKFIESATNNLPDLSRVGKILINHMGITPDGYTEKIIKKYVK